LRVLESDEAKGLVRRALDGLSEEFHRVIHLVDLEGMPYGEAAAVLKLPVNTVRSRLSRARTALKKKLETSWKKG
jgi:RNA polymerase sigma-70 factor (ECF subfamily)